MLEFEALYHMESVENKVFLNLFTARFLKMKVLIVFTMLMNIYHLTFTYLGTKNL